MNIFINSTEYSIFKQGAVIFKEGDPGNFAYAVKDGEVEILVNGKVVERVLAGSIFGEMALIDQTTRSATAVAMTDCQLVPISEKQFNLLVQQTPYFALDVMRVMTDRLRRVNVAR